ncbi:MAG TPA: hypothetical protein V6C76_11715 [Drouetiella sp.]
MPYEADRFAPLPVLEPKSVVRGQLISETPAAFMSRYPRAFASITITISGTTANGDQLKVDINLPALPGGKISKTISLVGGDTVSSAAQKLAKAICDDATLQGYGVYANSLLGVVTLNWPGPLGNNVTITQSVVSGAETIALSNSGAMSGGSGPIIPTDTFNFAYKRYFHSFQAHKPENVSDAIVKALATAGKPIR